MIGPVRLIGFIYVVKIMFSPRSLLRITVMVTAIATVLWWEGSDDATTVTFKRIGQKCV